MTGWPSSSLTLVKATEETSTEPMIGVCSELLRRLGQLQIALGIKTVRLELVKLRLSPRNCRVRCLPADGSA